VGHLGLERAGQRLHLGFDAIWRRRWRAGLRIRRDRRGSSVAGGKVSFGSEGQARQFN
jgi:hypothetical protein